MSRVIIIADIHGCKDELIDLIDKIRLTKNDRLIGVGDYVDRGPDSAGVIDTLIQLNAEGVRGNHDQRHLDYRLGVKDITRAPTTHKITAKQLLPHHYDWLNNLPLTITLPEYNALIVHAGVFPGTTLDQQKKEHLLHIQNICPSESNRSKWPSKSPPHWVFWTQIYKGPERIIFGHTVLNKPMLTEYVAGIDTGCVFGGGLTGIILPDWTVVSVPTRSGGYHGRRVNKIKITDDFWCFS